MRPPVIIPAYNPDHRLPGLVAALKKAGFSRVLVVDDGSRKECAGIFQKARAAGAVLLRHAVNRGKGAALKTAFNELLLTQPKLVGCVTVDADGQHLPKDVLALAAALEAKPRQLHLGVRRFGGETPLRSMVGNRLTLAVFALVTGERIQDTQTGLRGLPAGAMRRCLAVRYDRYEFEMEMLVQARRWGFPIAQTPIETVYLDGNRQSHFNPVLDSFRIYLVLLRYTFASLVGFAVDYLGFLGVFALTTSVPWATGLARAASLGVNYGLNRRLVFHSKRAMRFTLPAYLALALVSASLSAFLVMTIHERWGLPIPALKIGVDSLLYFLNFLVQRSLIFNDPPPSAEP